MLPSKHTSLKEKRAVMILVSSQVEWAGPLRPVGSWQRCWRNRGYASADSQAVLLSVLDGAPGDHVSILWPGWCPRVPLLLPPCWTGISHACSSLEHWSLTILRKRAHSLGVWTPCTQTSPESRQTQVSEVRHRKYPVRLVEQEFICWRWREWITWFSRLQFILTNVKICFIVANFKHAQKQNNSVILLICLSRRCNI